MKKYLLYVILIIMASCQAKKSAIKDNVTIKINVFEVKDKEIVSPMPELKAESALNRYKRRFEYLLVNIPTINSIDKRDKRSKIFNLYPDTLKVKKLYLKELTHDKKLKKYFEQTMAPIVNPDIVRDRTFTTDELMEVASKFFYCDKVRPDTSIQSHVCIGINGLDEAQWEEDYTLLEAFCFEAIFNNFEKDTSEILISYASEKKTACELHKKNIITLDKYLEDVKHELFSRMKNSDTIKKELLSYYNLNKSNLAFKIAD